MQNKNTAIIFNCLHKTFLFFLPELGWGVTTTALSWQAGWWWRIDRWISTTTTTTTTTPTISKRDKQIHFCKFQFELTALLSGAHCKCLVYWWTQIPFQRGLWNWWVRTYWGTTYWPSQEITGEYLTTWLTQHVSVDIFQEKPGATEWQLIVDLSWRIGELPFLVLEEKTLFVSFFGGIYILVGRVIFLFFLSFLLYFLFRGVAMVSLWPGAVKTEYIQVLISCHINFHVELKII